MITLGFVAALRRSELVKLRWSDVEFQANAVRVRLRRPKWRTGAALSAWNVGRPPHSR